MIGDMPNAITAKGKAADAAISKPRTRQRIYKQPPALAVPDIDEDAAERKRVLNVLAQRRYRQRKRETQKSDRDGRNSYGSTSDSSESPPAGGASVQSSRDDNGAQHVSAVTAGSVTPSVAMNDDLGITHNLADLSMDALLPSDGQLMSIDSLSDDQLSFLFADNRHLPTGLPSSKESPAITPQSQAAFANAVALRNEPGYIDPSVLRASSSSQSATSAGSPAPSLSLDSYVLPFSGLTLLRAMVRIAATLNCDSMWELDANSTFNLGISPPSELLPKSFQPTSSQILLPHHPILDFVPWPGVRDRLIHIMTLPDQFRPLRARGPLAVVNFAQDIEHEAEGARITGEDPMDEKGWEVGQVLYQRWWFVFDHEVVQHSNRLRRLRGAPPLRAGSVCTES